VVELCLQEAPHHVSALRDLARRGLLDGQAPRWADGLLGVEFAAGGEGDPTAGCRLPPEVHRAEIRHGTLFEPLDRPGGGRFVIALVPLPELEGRATVLGRVILGARLLDRLGQKSRIESAVPFPISFR
jgi:hypothetical protein